MYNSCHHLLHSDSRFCSHSYRNCSPHLYVLLQSVTVVPCESSWTAVRGLHSSLISLDVLLSLQNFPRSQRFFSFSYTHKQKHTANTVKISSHVNNEHFSPKSNQTCLWSCSLLCLCSHSVGVSFHTTTTETAKWMWPFHVHSQPAFSHILDLKNLNIYLVYCISGPQQGCSNHYFSELSQKRLFSGSTPWDIFCLFF